MKLFLCVNQYSDDLYTPDHLLIVAESPEDALGEAIIRTGVREWDVTQVMIPGYIIEVKSE